MDLNDLRVMLIQELGMNITVCENVIVMHWKLDESASRRLLFFVDDETELVYITTGFDDAIVARAKVMERLLVENMALSFVKFGMDREGHVMALVEIPVTSCTAPLLKRGMLAIYRASARYFEILKEDQEG